MAQHFIKDSLIESGSDGSCNSEAVFNSDKVINGEGRIFGDFYVCGKPGVDGDCKLISSNEWKGIWANCKEKDGDECYNAATNSTKGVNQFHMGACSDGTDIYDPIKNTGGAKCGIQLQRRRQGQTWDAQDNIYKSVDSEAECLKAWPNWGIRSGMSFGSRCGIDKIRTGKAKGLRPAYPTRKGVLPTIGNRSSTSKGNKPIQSMDADDKYFNDPKKLTPCPQPLSKKLTCFADGFHGVKTGYGCGMGDDTDPQNALNFCKRPDSHFADLNILKCCLGEKGSVRTDGAADAGHKYCPKDFCRTNIEYSKVDADEMNKCSHDEEKQTDNKVCYKLSDKCNERLKKICNRSVFFKEKGSDWLNILPYCVTWATVQPTEFKKIASEICSIPYDNSEPKNNDLSIKSPENKKKQETLEKLFTNRLCRDYIQSEWDINKAKLNDICQYAVQKKTSGRCYGTDKDLYPEKDPDQPPGKQDSVKATPENPCWQLTVLGNKKWAKDTCPCFYPEEYFSWYKKNKFNKGDTTSNIAVSANIKPECYMPECQRTLLYDKTGLTGGCPSLQICTQSIERKIVSIGGENLKDGQTSNSIKLPSGGDKQQCNFSNIIKEKKTVDTTNKDSSGGSRSGSGSGSGSGSESESVRNDFDDDDDFNNDNDNDFNDDGDTDKESMLEKYLPLLIVVIFGSALIYFIIKKTSSVGFQENATNMISAVQNPGGSSPLLSVPT